MRVLRWLLVGVAWGQPLGDYATAPTDHHKDDDDGCRVSRCARCSFLDDRVCDRCDSGYTLARRGAACETCAAGCATCEIAGARSCDECLEGYALDADRSACLACTRGCAVCDAAALETCVACFRFLWTPDDVGGCRRAQWSIELLKTSIGACAVLALLYAWRRATSATATAAGGVVAVDPVDPAAPSRYPSGAWRGAYTIYGRDRGLVEFELCFAGGLISGSGVDDVGAYSIAGRETARGVEFAKTYAAGSRNHAGRATQGNRGHTVEYVARSASAAASHAAGLTGNWSIRHALGNRDGKFHLWPVRVVAAHDAGGDGGDDDPEGECCVCMDARIDTRLRPCGHVALCSQCTTRLPRPKRCPICRANVQSVDQLQAPAMPPTRAETNEAKSA